jgi:ribonuclease HI
MKALKFSSDQIDNIKKGLFFKTWRLYDDKDIGVGDCVQFIDSASKHPFGYGLIKKIIIKRIDDLDDSDKNGHKVYESQEQMISEFNKYYGQNVNLDTVIKVIEFEFVQKNPQNTNVKKTMVYDEIRIYTDGGSRGNPGPSACAYVIYSMEDTVVKTDGQYLGVTTNNQAEYQAVKLALKEAKKISAKKIHIFMDSLLVVNQMNGIYKIKNRDLWPINQDIKLLVDSFEKVSFTHIPREMNKLADQEVNDILDSNNNSGISSNLV